MEQTIAIIGGDARYLELIRQLQIRPHTTIHLIGYDKIDHGFSGLNQLDFRELEVEKLDALILPITGTDDVGKVETVFSDQNIVLKKFWFERLQNNALVFTGMANPYVEEAIQATNAQLIPLLNRDDVAIYNSIPTAEGTIMMAMENTDYTLHSSHVMVTGYGRVGKTVAQKFSALGANVSVSTKSMKELARIAERGHQAVPLDTLAAYVKQTDLLINTIPAQVITKEIIQQLPSHSLIIDLASNPGGTDFRYAHRRGIKTILAKSLPGIVAPKTAGKILADVIQQYLEKNITEDL